MVCASLIPANEEARLEAVRRYDILDTPPDGAFERITAISARLFDVPIAIVSIVDHDRIWFKSHHGIDAEQIDREPGLCASAILQEKAWVVTDAETDPRTLTNPLVVGELGLRFYAGVPLVTHDGFNLGTLNVIDVQPREVGDDELAMLDDLAAIVMDELELRLAARRVEARLDQNQTDFLVTASHELRTPLAAVYGAAKSLAREETSLDAELRARLVAVIDEQSERLVSLVDDVLVAAQLGSGTLRILADTFDPLWAARSALEAARAAAPAGIRLELREPDAPLPELVSDGARVRQILASLLDNAIKYSPAGGLVELSVQAGADGIRFSVRDEGAGVPEAERGRIFEKFYRLDPDLTQGVAGTGLGLYIARELADRLGGTLAVDAAPTGGSIFSLRLPLGRRA